MSKHTRITRATFQYNDRIFTITFQADGIHIREKWQRDERIISLAELCNGGKLTTPEKASRGIASGTPGETLDVAACDLLLLAHDKTPCRETIQQVKQSVLAAQKIIRSLEVLI